MGVKQRRYTRRAVVTSTLQFAGAAGASLSMAGCGQRLSARPPVKLRWLTWGTNLPPSWTAWPGLPMWRGFVRLPAFVPSRFRGRGEDPVEPMRMQISSFLNDHPNVQVEIITERHDRYDAKLTALAAADVFPDVAAVDVPHYLPLARQGTLASLNRLHGLSSRDFMRSFPRAYLNGSLVRGRLYGLPYAARHLVLFVNKTLFAGRSVPLPPLRWGTTDWTWDTFLQRASRLTKFGLNRRLWQVGTLFGGRPMWTALMRQNGVREFTREVMNANYSQPGAVEAIQWLADLMQRHHVAPTPEENTRHRFTFHRGNVAMWWWYQSAIPILRLLIADAFDWDIYPLPMKRQPATYAEWSYLTIGSHSLYQDVCWDLVQFLGSAEGDQLALAAGYSSPLTAAMTKRSLIRAGVTNRTVVHEVAAQPFATRPPLDYWEEARAVMDFALQPVWQGQSRAQLACRKLNLLLDDMLAESIFPLLSVGQDNTASGG